MITEQLCLWEDDKPKIKNVDYVDLHTLPDDPARTKYGDGDLQYKDIPVGKYFIFRTGGYSTYHPELGKVFPYVQDQLTGKIKIPKAAATDMYPKISVSTNKKSFLTKMHRLSLLAFFPLPHDFYNKKFNWVGDHIDRSKDNYQLYNLRWATPSQNNSGTRADTVEVQKAIGEFYLKTRKI